MTCILTHNPIITPDHHHRASSLRACPFQAAASSVRCERLARQALLQLGRGQIEPHPARERTMRLLVLGLVCLGVTGFAHPRIPKTRLSSAMGE